MTIKRSKGSLGVDWAKGNLDLVVTFGLALEAIRGLTGESQSSFAKKIGVSRAYLCDIEKGRRIVSPGKAAKFARAVGHPPEYFVQLAVDDLLRSEGLKMRSHVEAA
jgi:transcriptional regulator with XRE-family HTH domain